MRGLGDWSCLLYAGESLCLTITEPALFKVVTLCWMSAIVLDPGSCSGSLLWSALRSDVSSSDVSQWAGAVVVKLLLCDASFSHVLFQYFFVSSLGGSAHMLSPCH